MRFIKYHGLGNDFIILDPQSPDFRIGYGLTPDLARALCDRSFGIGGDGVMVVASPQDPANHAAMELINSDGTTPEMCGNGIRCAAKFAVEELGFTANPLNLETPGGVRACHWTADDAGEVETVRVAMGRPSFERAAIPVRGTGDADDLSITIDARTFTGTGVNVGNPHFVSFGDSTEATARRWGPPLEHHESFPEKANIGFATVEGPQELRVTVWERACGLTWACGTGATAAAAAAVRTGRVEACQPIRVNLRGGALQIDLSDPNEAFMIGPATKVFVGEFELGSSAASTRP